MSLRVSRILHAGYLFEYGSTQIAFDPIFENPFSRNCFAFPDVRFDVPLIQSLKFEAVFISHFHDDHCSLESLTLIDRRTPIYIFCLFDEMISLIKSLGFDKVISLKLDEKLCIGEIEVTARRALDEDVDSIFHVRAGDINVLNVVDSWIPPATFKILQQTKWNLVLWPFQTMRELEVLAPRQFLQNEPEYPHELIEQLRLLQPDTIVPSSCQFRHEEWSWYNRALFPMTYAGFSRMIKEILPDTKIVRLNPGVSVDVSVDSITPAPALTWIHPSGPQDVDYGFDPNCKPMPTSEIARHLEKISPDDFAKVVEFCRRDLINRYQQLHTADESYFRNGILWQLSVYDPEGAEHRFIYQLDGSSIKKIESVQKDFGWTTEIPASKLLAAIDEGEALSSLYLRINDYDFSPSTSAAIREVDIVEDPLIRCLYTNSFGSYQKAQLRRIKVESL